MRHTHKGSRKYIVKTFRQPLPHSPTRPTGPPRPCPLGEGCWQTVEGRVEVASQADRLRCSVHVRPGRLVPPKQCRGPEAVSFTIPLNVADCIAGNTRNTYILQRLGRNC